MFANRTQSYNRAYAYGESMQRENSALSFGIVETQDESGKPCHCVELWENSKLFRTDMIPANFNEPGTLG